MITVTIRETKVFTVWGFSIHLAGRLWTCSHRTDDPEEALRRSLDIAFGAAAVFIADRTGLQLEQRLFRHHATHGRVFVVTEKASVPVTGEVTISIC
jgi:hypothetical protein